MFPKGSALGNQDLMEKTPQRHGGLCRQPAVGLQVLESLCGADKKAVVELHQVLQAEVHTREAWTQSSVQSGDLWHSMMPG